MGLLAWGVSSVSWGTGSLVGPVILSGGTGSLVMEKHEWKGIQTKLCR